MSIELLKTPTHAIDPLDSVEAVAAGLEMDSERVGHSELHIMLPGVWRDLGLWFTWRPELSTLQLGASLELKAPPNRITDVSRLTAMVNERLWIGHFEVWTDDRAVVYRNASVLSESHALDKKQAEGLIRGANEAVDRFYPAFNYLIWAGKTPDEALRASLFETVGNA